MSISSDDCSIASIPTHLHRKAREKTHVQDEESLYRRFFVKGPKEEWIKGGKKASSSLFKLDRDSYNRSNYSDPEDVLYDDKGSHFSTAGILFVKVSDLRHEDSQFTIQENDSLERTFTFVVEHVPEPCNYSHTEVIVYENGSPAVGRPDSLKTAFRKMLIKHSNIHKDVE